MRYGLLFTILSSLFALGLWLDPAHGDSAQNSVLVASYVTCFDGDTCTVDIPGLGDVLGRKATDQNRNRMPIRLRGIDAPEMKGRCLQETAKAISAREHLRARLKSAKVLRFVNPTRDKYFRLDVTILADGKNVNEEMVTMGLARPYDGATRQGWCP